MHADKFCPFLQSSKPKRRSTSSSLAMHEDLAEQGLVAVNIGGAGEGKTKQTGSSGGRTGEQGRPSRSEGRFGCRPQRTRHVPCSERGGGRTGQPWNSSGLQPQVQGQQANAVTRGRCIPQPCGQGAERRHSSCVDASAQLDRHRVGTQLRVVSASSRDELCSAPGVHVR